MTDTQPHSFDWAGAAEHNRDALLRIVMLLFDIVGLGGNAVVATLPRCTRAYVLRILRPAESAARRLILIAAVQCGWKVRPIDGNRKTGGMAAASRGGGKQRNGSSAPDSCSLPLIDPLKRFDLAPRRRYAKSVPRITCLGLSGPVHVPENRIPAPDDLVSVKRLCARLVTLRRALEDIDGHARRLARWRARRDLGLLRAKRFSPMRPGWPPGYLKRPRHEVDEVLRECHSLAVYVQRHDTS